MAEDIRLFLDRFQKVKQTGSNQYICRCPAHADKTASLSIRDDTMHSGKILLKCHAGCNTKDILTEIGCTMKDIMPEREEEKKPLQRWQINLTAEYRYTDEKGNYLYSKLRYESPEIEGKIIRYGRIVDGNYTSGKGGAEGSLYNLRKMQTAISAGKTIYYTEGEKDVESLREIGLVAVTAGGTGDWKKAFARHFIGTHDVVILADNDKPGAELAEKVARDLRDIVYCVRIVTPSNDRHGDVTDYLEDGGDKDKLLKLVKEADEIKASWIIKDKDKINPSLLADAVHKYNDIIVAHNPGTKSDQILWYRNGVYKACSDTEVEAEINKYLPSKISNPATLRNTRQMLLVKSKFIDYDLINADEHYINVRNGLLTVPELRLVPHTPSYYSTTQLACEYDPRAKAPVWEDFKRTYCKDEDGNFDEEMYRLDKMKAGLILSNIYGYRLKGAFVQYSAEGNTGKSVDCEILTQMLGVNNTANVSFQEMSNDRWANGRCWGKRLVVVGDQGRESIKDSSTFKQLTGGDSISAELKGLQHFMYRFRGVILVSCNHLPVFEDDKGDHMSKRLKFIHSRNVIEEENQDVYLRDKLQGELSGILNWALEGLRDYISNGYSLCTCKSSEALLDEYRGIHDTLYAFMREEYVKTKQSNDYVDKVAFEKDYLAYCKDTYGLENINKRAIKNRMAAHGVPLVKRGGYWVYKGIKPRIETSEEAVAGTPFEQLGIDLPY